MSGFQDHFSTLAAGYARFRPRYPAELFEHLAGLAPRRDVAWDCATGSGQAAVALAEHFTRVWATDASAGQIAHAQPNPRVHYGVALAERSGLAGSSVDLVTVAQALHWFDLDAFYPEVRRVLRPGGILAAWCYGPVELPGSALQEVVDRFYSETVGPYWPPERLLVEDGYRSLAFPFEELEAPRFTMEARLTPDQLAGYLGTWSATRRYVEATGHDPIPELREELTRLWSPAPQPVPARWPISLRVGRGQGSGMRLAAGCPVE